MIASLRRRVHVDERGMTLVELMTVMLLLGIVMSVVYGLLASVQKSVGTETHRSITNDNVRLAMEGLDKEIRSANAFTVTTSNFTTAVAVNTAGSYLSVYTQTNAPTRQVSDPDTSGYTCVQWKRTGTNLQTRYWPINWRADPTALIASWRTVAESVTAASFLVPSTGASDAYGKRLLRSTITIQADSTDPASAITQERDMDGRNVLTTPTTDGEPNPCLTDPPP